MVLKIITVYHRDEELDRAPADHCRLNLERLDCTHRSNLLGEGRLFLSDFAAGPAALGDADYVAVANARWDSKYWMIKTRLAGLRAYAEEHARPDLVLAPWPTDCGWLPQGRDWYVYSKRVHPGMRHLLREMLGVTGMSPGTGRVSLWANDFVCHRRVFLEFVAHWRYCFAHFHGRYGHLLPMHTNGMDVARYPAYFYERCSTVYWANRSDLTVVGVP